MTENELFGISEQLETHDKRTETHACDCVSRQAALDAIKKLEKPAPTAQHLSAIFDCEDTIKALPSAQPDHIADGSTKVRMESKYEYHYDHTDCIWYRPEARNRCPSTCAQYRDGWNDAMQYIFRDGKGYRPYRRDKHYEGSDCQTGGD